MRYEDCGSAVIYVPKVKTLTDGTKKTYKLYWCADSKKWHWDNGVKIKSFNEKKLDKVFETMLEHIAIPLQRKPGQESEWG